MKTLIAAAIAVAAVAMAAAMGWPILWPTFGTHLFENATLQLKHPQGWSAGEFSDDVERSMSVRNFKWIKDSSGVGTDRRRPVPFDTKWDRFFSIHIYEYRQFTDPKEIYDQEVQYAMSPDGGRKLKEPPPIQEITLADGTPAIAYEMPPSSRESSIMVPKSTGFWRSMYGIVLISRDAHVRHVVFRSRNGLMYEVVHDVDTDFFIRCRYAPIFNRLIKSIEIK